MSKRKIILPLTVATVTPLVTLPMINATKTLSSSIANTIADDPSIGIRHLTNVPDLVIRWDTHREKNKKTYTVRFITNDSHPEWGIYGEIYRIDEEASHASYTNDDLIVPATVTQNIVEYKIRGIDTGSRWSDYKQISTLDFSQAYWLDYIGHDSFNAKRLANSSAITTVRFTNLPNLTKVSYQVFRGVHAGGSSDVPFTEPDGCYDLSASPLETIDHRAFQSLCSVDDNRIDMIIMPKTIKSIGEDAFGYCDNRKDSRPRFKKIIWTSDEPPANLFGPQIAMPQTISTGRDDCQIIVPPGCADKYKKLKNFDGHFKDQVYETKIQYKDGYKGNQRIVGVKGKDGFDPLKWNPYHLEKKTAVENAITRVSNDYGGKIRIDEQHRVSWSNDLPVGTYKFTVQSFIYDDNQNKKMSAAISEPVYLDIIDNAHMSGGSNVLYMQTQTAGRDAAIWEPYVPGHKVTDADYKMITKETGVSVEKDGIKGRVCWDNTISKIGEIPSILRVAVYIDGYNNPIICDQPILFRVREKVEGFTFGLSVNDEVYKSTPITEDSTLKVTPGEMPEGYVLHEPPYVSINQDGEELIKLEQSGSQYKADLKPATVLTNKRYKFRIYSEATKEGSETQYIYSDLIDVKGTNAFDPLSIPSEIFPKYETADYQTISVIPQDSNAKLTSASLKPTQWTQAGEIMDHVKVELAENKKDIVISWDEEFTKKTLDDWIDVRLDLDIETETNDTTQFVTSLSFVTRNKGEIKYEGSKTLYSYADQAKVFEDPYKLLVNDLPPESEENVIYDCVVDCDDPQIYEQFIGMQQEGLEAKLQCRNITESSETLDGLSIYVYALDTNKKCIASDNVKLYIGNQLSLDNVTEKIKCEYGVGGKTDPFTITFNGVEDPTTTVKLSGDPGFSIQDNCIVWDKTLAPGAYILTLTASKEYGAKSYTATKYIEVSITYNPPEPTPEIKSNNTGLIIGCSVGGAVVVGGAAAGTTIGVKKHKAKIGHKK